MQNIDLKYGEVTTEHGQFIDGEPVIVFRARDLLVPNILRHYRELCRQSGSPPHHIDAIEQSLSRIEQWQSDHIDDVIVPRSDRWAERVGEI